MRRPRFFPQKIAFQRISECSLSGASQNAIDLFSKRMHNRRGGFAVVTTNPLERLNLEIRRRTRVVGIFPHPGACMRLIGMLLVERHEDWLTDDKAYLGFNDDGPAEEIAAKVVTMAVLVQIQDWTEVGRFRAVEVRASDYVAKAACQISGIVAVGRPSLPILNWPFLIFSGWGQLFDVVCLSDVRPHQLPGVITAIFARTLPLWMD